jgi:hypothetical protein
MEDFPIHLDMDLHKIPCDLVDASFMIRKGKAHNFARHHIKTELVKNNETGIEEQMRTVDPNIANGRRNVTQVL